MFTLSEVKLGQQFKLGNVAFVMQGDSSVYPDLCIVTLLNDSNEHILMYKWTIVTPNH